MIFNTWNCELKLGTIHKDPMEHSADNYEKCVHGEIFGTNIMDETGTNTTNA